MATMERNHPQSYYYSDRSYYNSYPAEKEVVMETKKPRVTPCMWVLAVIFLLFIIVLIICLIIFFTWGAAYATGPAATGVTVSPSAPSSQLLLDQPGLLKGKTTGLHFDLDLPKFVLNALKTGAPKICVLDTAYFDPDYKKLFNQEHIPGARHFDIEQIAKSSQDGSVQLAHPLDFQAYVRSLGVDNDCHVITYDHGEQANSIVTSTFVWWLFKLYGHSKVTVMNGGLKEWKKYTANDPSYQPVSGQQKTVAPGDFRAMWNPAYVTTYPDVLQKVQEHKGQIVDTRRASEFSGTTKSPDSKESGRIKYAVNAPGDEIINAEGGLKNLQEIKEWLRGKNVDSSKPSVVYDNSALHASAVYFSMVQAGYEAKLYDDGWVEWSYKAPTEFKEKGERS